ncbi:MAG: serine/threonine protein kinase [Proteobacteria bacterium]|nr:serine/threonine protein kinase [Pseudomonadota bacterium]
MNLKPGDIVAERYKLCEIIGSGGMGGVYKAEHTLLKKTVAIKVLHADVSNNEEFVKRFRREAQAAASIEHPNICTVLDFGVLPEGDFILIMEHLDGETLQNRLQNSEAFTAFDIIYIMVQLLGVLQCAHDKGIVHRDVKPENIYLINRDDDCNVVKLIDFGISRMDDDAPASEVRTNLTQAGVIYGTPQYISPEQANGWRVDYRADLYACGVILYEMIARKLPFTGASLIELLSMHSFAPPPHLKPDAIEEAEAFDAIIQKLLQKSKGERFQSADEVIEALSKIAFKLFGNQDKAASLKGSSSTLLSLLNHPNMVKKRSSFAEKSPPVSNQAKETVKLPAKSAKPTRRLIPILIGICVALLIPLFFILFNSNKDSDLETRDGTAPVTAHAVESDGNADTPEIYIYDPELSPFTYGKDFIAADAVLQNHPAVISAQKHHASKEYALALEELKSIYDRYRTNPNFLLFYAQTLQFLYLEVTASIPTRPKPTKNSPEVLEAAVRAAEIMAHIDELLNIVPDALRNETLKRIIYNFMSQTYAVLSIPNRDLILDVFNRHTSPKFARGLAELIIHFPYADFDRTKKSFVDVFDKLPKDDDFPAWLLMAVRIWTIPRESCEERLQAFEKLFEPDLNIAPEILLELTRKALLTTEKCTMIVERQKGIKCLHCMREWLDEKRIALEAQIALEALTGTQNAGK